MKTLRSRTTSLLLAGLLALALSVVATGTAAAHTMPKRVANKTAKNTVESLVVILREDGVRVRDYGLQACRRLSRHKFACVTFVKAPDEYGMLTCTHEWQIGVRRHSQYNPVVRYMSDATQCQYPAPAVDKG